MGKSLERTQIHTSNLEQKKRLQSRLQVYIYIYIYICMWKWNKWHEGGSSVSTSLYPLWRPFELDQLLWLVRLALFFCSLISLQGRILDVYRYGCYVVCMLYSGLLQFSILGCSPKWYLDNSSESLWIRLRKEIPIVNDSPRALSTDMHQPRIHNEVPPPSRNLAICRVRRCKLERAKLFFGNKSRFLWKPCILDIFGHLSKESWRHDVGVRRSLFKNDKRHQPTFQESSSNTPMIGLIQGKVNWSNCLVSDLNM